jgi:hypothetical protein
MSNTARNMLKNWLSIMRSITKSTQRNIKNDLINGARKIQSGLRFRYTLAERARRRRGARSPKKNGKPYVISTTTNAWIVASVENWYQTM